MDNPDSGTDVTVRTCAAAAVIAEANGFNATFPEDEPSVVHL